MLLELHVRNYALIDNLSLSVKPGFTVLTGETGAGKSIIIDALTTVLGGRIQSADDVIRSGADSALVEASFAMNASVAGILSDLGIEGDEILVLSREISHNGRSRCRINGRLSTVSALTQLGRFLVDIHGQHEHYSLLSAARHLNILDAFAGEQVIEVQQEVKGLVRERKSIRAELHSLREGERERARQLDILAFQADEIAAAQLVLGEDEELAGERSVLANAEKLNQELSQAYMALYESESRADLSAYDLIGQALRSLEEVTRYDPQAGALLESLRAVEAQLAEIGRDVRLRHEDLRQDPDRLAQVEERLELIERLKRKYGSTIDEILKFAAEVDAEAAELASSESRTADLEARLVAVEKKVRTAADQLHQLREKAALELARRVQKHLSELGMRSAAFGVELSERESEDGLEVNGKKIALTEQGWDSCQFLFSANPGEEKKPLARIASGGEISRVMLALKAVVAEVDPVPTLIFDEVDSGLGGKTANAVAQKLADLSQSHQVLCVTHLAQIASAANTHFHIAKAVEAEITRVSLSPLAFSERVSELARMLDGTQSPATLEHARQMLAWTQKGAN